MEINVYKTREGGEERAKRLYQIEYVRRKTFNGILLRIIRDPFPRQMSEEPRAYYSRKGLSEDMHELANLH